MGNCFCYDYPSPIRDTFLPSNDNHISLLYHQHSEKLLSELIDLYKIYSNSTFIGTHSISISNTLQEENLEFFLRLLPECQSLMNLKLTNNSLGILGGKALYSPLTELKSLEHLTISHNSLNDEGIEAICASFSFTPKLKYLDFSFNDFSAVGGEKIAEALIDLDLIESVLIKGNQLTRRTIEKIAKVLKGKEFLRKFEFDSEGVKESDLEKIKMLLPRIYADDGLF